MSGWQFEMVHDLKQAGHGEADQVIAGYAATTGLSVAQLYRTAKKFGYRTERKPRTDKGVLACGLTDGQVDYIAGLVAVTARDNKGGIMSVERAIKIAADNNVIEPGQVSASGMQRILRDREVSKAHLKEPTPHVQMRSLHPNHVHAVDVSVCIQYYLKNGQLKVMREAEFNKNKPENFKKVKTRLLRYLVVDHFSGAFHLKYYDTTGETAANLFDFLCEAWTAKPDERMPFRGVPFFLLMDAGSAALSKPMTVFFDTLDVKRPKNLPHNPRRQGCVETMHNVIEQWFESGLKIQPATSVSQLNTWALDFSIYYQRVRDHSRHGIPRIARWLQITREQLREVGDRRMLQEVYAMPRDTRRVDGQRCISVCGNTYSLRNVQGVRRGVEVLFTIKPYFWPQIDVLFDDTLYQVSPVEMLPKSLGGFQADAVVIGEEYRAQPETATQQAAKRIDDMAYGENKKGRPFAGTVVFGTDADRIGNLTPIKRVGTPMELGREIVPASMPLSELFKRLRAELGRPIEPAMNKELKAVFGASIDTKTADDVIQAIAAGEDWRPVSATRHAL